MEIGVFTGFTGAVSAATFDHSEQYLFAGAMDKTAKLWALKNNKRKYRNRIIFEVCAVISIIISAILILPYTEVFLIYVILMIMGSWIIPLVTSYFVHNPFASHELLQTRLFRGRLYSLLSFEHLFHLEHHLYPMVPHKNWPVLAKRLDPFFKANKIKPDYFLGMRD